MSRQVAFNGWVSIVPTDMVKSWLEKKYMKTDRVLYFSDSDKVAVGQDYIMTRMSLNDEYKWAKNAKEERALRKLGYKSDKHYVCVINDKILVKMHKEVNKWYDAVFNYVEKWLKDKGLLKISKGSVLTSFCVESDSEKEVVKDWGAPLGKSGNKVDQVKEKFGRITVYFSGLTDKERGMVDAFAKVVELLYDCETCFA